MLLQKYESIPSLVISDSKVCKKVLILLERVLIGKFIGICPNSHIMDIWLSEHWSPKLQNQVNFFVAGRGFFIFLFSSMEERDLIFNSGP